MRSPDSQTPTLFAVDMAALSLHAYGDHREPFPPGWEEIPSQELGSHGISTIYPGEQDHAIGFNYRVRVFRHGVAYRKNNLIALAVRGTDITISSKILDNIMNDDTSILFQKIPDLYYFTRDIAAKLREKYPNFTLVHTGHSLGAAVASLVAATHGETAIVFDSPGVQGIVEKNSSLKIKSNSDITIYQSTRNIVNTVGRPLAIAKVKRLQPSPELDNKLKEILKGILFLKTFRPRLYGILNIAAVFIRHTLASHSIGNMVHSLRNACHESYTVKEGDCLIKIAIDKYGDERLWRNIYERNKSIIGNDSNFIKTGINITIAHPAPKKELVKLNSSDLLHTLKDKNKDALNTDKVEMCLSHGIDVDANELSLSDKNEALHAAAEQGSLEYIEFLLKKGASVDAKSREDETPLHVAARNGNTECAKFLIEKSASVNAKDRFDRTPLHIAANSRSENCLKFLLDKGAAVDAKDKNGETSLHVAAGIGNTAHVTHLLNKGASAHERDKNGAGPLHFAAKSGNPECVQLLLGKGIDANAECFIDLTPLHDPEDADFNPFCYTGNDFRPLYDLEDTDFNPSRKTGNNFKFRCRPLHFAAGSGNPACIELLLRYGAHAQGWEEILSPLHFAASSGNPECVSLLLVNLDRNSFHRVDRQKILSPLHFAAKSGNPECVELLLSRFILDDDRDSRPRHDDCLLKPSAMHMHHGGFNIKHAYGPIHFAAGSGNVECVKLLLNRGGRAQHSENSYWKDRLSPLHFAAKSGNPKCVEFLLDLDFSTRTQSKCRTTPLHFAAKSGNAACVKLLLDQGIPADSHNRRGETPLHFAAKKGNPECVKLLLEKGASVNAKNENDETSLHVAARNGNHGCVKLLLEKGAAVDPKNGKGETPLRIAVVENRNSECVELLTNHGADFLLLGPDLAKEAWFRFFDKGVIATFHRTRTPVPKLPQNIDSAGILLSNLITSPLTTNGLQVVAESWVTTFKSVKSGDVSEKLFGKLKECLVLTQKSPREFNPMLFNLAVIDRVARLPELSLEMSSPVAQHIKTQVEVYQTQISCFEQFIQKKHVKLESQSISFMGDLKKVSASLNNSLINFGEITQTVASLEHGMRQLAKLPEVATGFVEHLLGDLDKVMSNPLEITFSGPLRKDLSGGFQFAGTLMSLAGKSELASQITAIGEASITVVSTLSDLSSSLIGSLAAGPFAPFVAIGGALKTILGVFGKLFGGGGPSQEVKMLEQIGKQITHLTQRMDARFDRIENMLSAGFERIEGMLDTIYKLTSNQFKEIKTMLGDIHQLNIYIRAQVKNAETKIVKAICKQNQGVFDHLRAEITNLPSFPRSLIKNAEEYARKLMPWVTVDSTLVSSYEKIKMEDLWNEISNFGILYNINALAYYATDYHFIPELDTHLLHPLRWAEGVQSYEAILMVTSRSNVTWHVDNHIGQMRKAGLRLKKFILDIKTNSRLFEHLALEYKKYVGQVFTLYNEGTKLESEKMRLPLEHVDAAYGIWISFAYLAFAENTQKKSALMSDIMTFELWTSADLVRYLSPQDERLLEEHNKTRWITCAQENAIKNATTLQEKIEKKIATPSQEICALISDTLKELDIMENVFARKKSSLAHSFFRPGVAVTSAAGAALAIAFGNGNK